jgi:CheY-like chemotaxis protein
MARILIVEDDAIAAELSALRLRGAAHHVDIVVDGLEALKALDTQPYDLVVADVMMPHMDGITMVKTIRQSGSPYAAIPVIGLSATTNPVSFPRMIDAGMNLVLTKPAQRSTLCEAVTSLLGDRQTPADVIDMFGRRQDSERVTG